MQCFLFFPFFASLFLALLIIVSHFPCCYLLIARVVAQKFQAYAFFQSKIMCSLSCNTLNIFWSSMQVVAIKQLDRNGLQGNREFLVEVLMLSLLHHTNLVNLIGYCADGDQRLLVYEYMSLGSLEDHLYGIFMIVVVSCSLINSVIVFLQILITYV